MRRIPSSLAAVAVLCLALAAPVGAQDYRIQPGDRLAVSVLEDPGLSREVLVRPDGKISLPLAGTIQAAGRTPEEVQAAVRRGLARDFIEPPSVSVALVEIAEEAPEDGVVAAIYVLGEVNSPGRYDVQLPLSVLQALALSGGPATFAARDRIQVRRGEGGAETVFLFNYDQIEDGLTPSPQINLRAGDVIVVPERGLFE